MCNCNFVLLIIYNYTVRNDWNDWGCNLDNNLSTLPRKLSQAMHLDWVKVKKMGAQKEANFFSKAIKEFGDEIVIALEHIQAGHNGDDCLHCDINMCNGGYSRFPASGSEPSMDRNGLML